MRLRILLSPLTRKGREALAEAEAACGFLTEAGVAALAADPGTRLELLLVRCGGRRFFAEARDVAARVAEAEAEGDHVRDVSVPAHKVRHVPEGT